MDYSRNKSTDKSSSAVEEEVRKLFKKSNGTIDQSEFLKLRSKYDNDTLVEKIQRVYLETHHKIVKKAKKFARLIREKYSQSNYPFHILLEKANAYRKKHGMSEEHFAEFKKIYEQELVGANSADVLVPMTNMMKVLGSYNVGFQSGKFKIDTSDHKYLQEILKMHAESKPLHAQILLQSIQYRDCAFEAIKGKFDPLFMHRPTDHVHPVVVALFLPRFRFIEEQFLHANIGGILNSRYQEEPLISKADYELFYNLISDPNDIVCSSSSPVEDLLNRYRVQRELWECVLSLRNGQYFDNKFRSFVTAIDMCKLNKYDTPDLVYGRFDGTIIKRLISCFSLRPSVVSTTEVVQPQFSINPYTQMIKPVVTTIPMLNLRLPHSSSDNTAVSLREALNQTQLFIEGGMVVPKNTSLIYSRGVLMFFIDRRTQIMRVSNHPPFNMGVLPIALSGFERLNDRVVSLELQLEENNENYELRSIVISEINNTLQQGHNIVIGSSTLVRELVTSTTPERYWHYNPYMVGKNNGVDNPIQDPVRDINFTPNLQNDGTSFKEKAETRGTIFIYQSSSAIDDPTKGLLQY